MGLYGLADAAAQVISTGVNAGVAAGQNRKQREWQSRENLRAYNRNVAMWKMQNEYNTPANQLARIKDANLNPHLMYGQGNTGNAGPGPQYEPAKGAFGIPKIELPQVMSIYYDLKEKDQRVQKLKSERHMIEQETYNKGLAAKILEHEVGWMPTKAEYMNVKYEQEKIREGWKSAEQMLKTYNQKLKNDGQEAANKWAEKELKYLEDGINLRRDGLFQRKLGGIIPTLPSDFMSKIYETYTIMQAMGYGMSLEEALREGAKVWEFKKEPGR